MCFSDLNTSFVSYPIPGNDDAIKAIEIITKTIADSYLEGREKYAKKSPQEKIATSEDKSQSVSG